jgi:hypothetical protein
MSLNSAISDLVAASTEEEYESLVKNMFLSLDRRNKRKVLKNKFGNQVTKALFKRK